MLLALALPVLAGFYSCGSPEVGIRLKHTIHFKGPEGTRVLKLVPRKDQVKLQDGAGKLLARFKLIDDRIRVQNPDHESIGVIVSAGRSAEFLRILEPEKGTLLYQLLREPDGDLRLEDGAGHVLHESKSRDYGFKTVDAMGITQSRVRLKRNKISIRAATGQTLLSTDDPVPAAAVACFTLQKLPIEFQAALALGVIHWMEPGA